MSSISNSSNRSAFAVIQAPVLYSKKLNDAEKIIYGHISNLCNEFGYCFATNHYLAELSDKSLAAIKRAIKKLTELNFIEINHYSKGKQDERQITLRQFPKSLEKGDGSKTSHPQLRNELPDSSKMSHRIIKEEYINKKTTTERPVLLAASQKPMSSSSSSRCKTKISKLENLPISDSQKQKIYQSFEEKCILQGLEWLESAGKRQNVGAALYDAIKNGYEPKMHVHEIIQSNKEYAKQKLLPYDNQLIKGYKIDICRSYVLFSTLSGNAKTFEYSQPTFRNDFDQFCARLGINSIPQEYDKHQNPNIRI